MPVSEERRRQRTHRRLRGEKNRRPEEGASGRLYQEGGKRPVTSVPHLNSIFRPEVLAPPNCRHVRRRPRSHLLTGEAIHIAGACRAIPEVESGPPVPTGPLGHDPNFVGAEAGARASAWDAGPGDRSGSRTPSWSGAAITMPGAALQSMHARRARELHAAHRHTHVRSHREMTADECRRGWAETPSAAARGATGDGIGRRPALPSWSVGAPVGRAPPSRRRPALAVRPLEDGVHEPPLGGDPLARHVDEHVAVAVEVHPAQVRQRRERAPARRDIDWRPRRPVHLLVDVLRGEAGRDELHGDVRGRRVEGRRCELDRKADVHVAAEDHDVADRRDLADAPAGARVRPGSRPTGRCRARCRRGR